MSILKFIEDKPRIILFAGNNDVAREVQNFLESRGEKLIAVFHEKDKINLSMYFPDVMITCYWPYLLSKEMIEIPKYGTINFHPALLPYNRGWYPSVWPFIDGSPAGVTLHLIDEGADTGPVIAQREVLIEETDNGGTIYKKSQDAMVELFKETWAQLQHTGIELQKQDHSKATYHSKKDANMLDELNLDYITVAKDTIDLIRAKTFGDKGYAYYMKDGVKYRVRLIITKDNG